MSELTDMTTTLSEDRQKAKPSHGQTAHRIDIEHVGYNSKGMLWRVTYEGKVIVERTRIPALDACRYLLALGKTGKLMMFRNGEMGLSVDIVTGAGLTVVETPTRGPVFGPHETYPCDDENEVSEVAALIG